MNQQEVEQFFSHAKAIRLSASAKRSGRAALRRSMAVQSEKAVPYRFAWPSFTWARAGSFAAFALLLSLSSTAWAAEKTLPGDILYGWKTKVNEPVHAALLPTSDAKAQWSLELFTRRLQEAEILASSGQLNDDVQTFLEEQLNEEREYANAYGQSVGEVERLQVEAEIQERSGSTLRIEVRDDGGRLRIRVRAEQEEREDEGEKQREGETRHEDGWIEESELSNGSRKEGGKADEDRQDEAADGLVKEIKGSVLEKKSSESTKQTSEKSQSITTSSTGKQSGSSGGGSDDDTSDDNSTTVQTSSLISESAARSKALAAVPGTVKDSDLKEMDNEMVWEVKVLRSSDSEEVKVFIDAKTGSITKIDD